jgi:hypothetical protein
MLFGKWFGNQNSRTIYTQQWLGKHKISQQAIIISMVNDKKVESLQVYLDKHHLQGDAIETSEDKIKMAEATQRLSARNLILWSLVVPMSVIPFWLMGLLTFNSLGRIKLSESLQVGILAAVASDYLGLYYVVTQDLFPQGKALSRRRARSGAKTSEPQPDDEAE